MTEEEEIENMNFGMGVKIPGNKEGKITLMDLFYGNVQGKFLALFLVIFTVLFATADMNTGYIKNIGGQVSRRSTLILSKAAALFVYTVLTFGVFLVVQLISSGIVFSSLEIGDVGLLLKYAGVEILLHFAFAMICMAAAIFLRNNVFTMILAVCMCMNVMQLLYSAIDKILEKAGIEGFHVIKYTVTGKIALLPYQAAGREAAAALAVGMAFAAIMLAVSCTLFEKRDIA